MFLVAAALVVCRCWFQEAAASGITGESAAHFRLRDDSRKETYEYEDMETGCAAI